MSTLDELGLSTDETPIEIPDEVPEESSGYVPLVQPGRYVFKLPDNMETIWTKIDTKDKGPRVSAGFTKDSPLVVVQDDTWDKEFNNAPVTTFINNIEFPRGREGVEVADMYYLIKALEANLPDEEKSPLSTNPTFVKAMQKHAGKMFIATVQWEAYCNPNKNIYIAMYNDDGTTASVDEQEGTLGCGAKYVSYTSGKYPQIPKHEDGRFKDRFDEFEVHGEDDGCPARLMANIRLSKFAPVTK